MIRTSFVATRRTSLLAMLGFALTGCGGGEPRESAMGTQQIKSIVSYSNGNSYPLYIYLPYLPPDSDATLATLPVIYRVQNRSYSGLAMAAKLYTGGHLGMIPAAFADGVAFALA